MALRRARTRDQIIAREQRRAAAWKIRARSAARPAAVFVLEAAAITLTVWAAWVIWFPAALITAAVCCAAIAYALDTGQQRK